MFAAALQPRTAWAEDRALLRSNPSAVPGAKTEGRAACQNRLPIFLTPPLRDWRQSDKPSRKDAATRMAGCPQQFANTNRLKFQFTVNQDTTASRAFSVTNPSRRPIRNMRDRA
jgi:hypothetical protein